MHRGHPHPPIRYVSSMLLKRPHKTKYNNITQRTKDKPCRIILEHREYGWPNHHKRIDIIERSILYCHPMHFTQCLSLDIQIECASTHSQEHKLIIVSHLVYQHSGTMIVLKCVIQHLQTNGMDRAPVIPL